MKKPVTSIICLILFFWLCLIGCAYLCSSCHVLKTRSKQSIDSTHIQKLDSGSLKQGGGQSRFENDWWRNTYLFPQPSVHTDGKDTVTLQPQYITQPIAVIHEGGKTKEDMSWYDKEIAWQRRYDSLSAQKQVTNTSKEVQSFTMWQLIGISMVGAVILFILQGIRNFKIVKR
jgi:hypothetical protein